MSIGKSPTCRTDRPKVIASLDGVATGGGFELAIACDLRIASDRIRMAELATQAGFVSEWSAARTLPKIIGLADATELILTGRFVDAEEALAMRLVNRVVPAAELDAATGRARLRVCRT